MLLGLRVVSSSRAALCKTPKNTRCTIDALPQDSSTTSTLQRCRTTQHNSDARKQRARYTCRQGQKVRLQEQRTAPLP